METASSPGDSVIIDGRTYKGHTAWCEPGESVLSGGHRFAASFFGDYVPIESYPIEDTDLGVQGWRVTVPSNISSNWTAWAVCAGSSESVE